MHNYDKNDWYIIGSTEDLPFRHVYHTELSGQELAVWRDDNGVVNAWENRCPHRGLRLSLGVNMGDRVRCQYHGWTYESGTGSCTFVPAHRESAPPASTRVYSFAVREQGGAIWASLGVPNQEPTISESGLSLRSLPLNVSAELLLNALPTLEEKLQEHLDSSYQQAHIHKKTDSIFTFTNTTGNVIKLFIQPQSAHKTKLHARFWGETSSPQRLQQQFLFAISEFRRGIESTYSKVAAKETIQSAETATNLELVANPNYKCSVTERTTEAEDIVAISLSPLDRAMPALTPGMHINVTTPAGHVRSYSIINAPDEKDKFIIGIKKEPDSRGGSKSMHDDVKVGSELKITLPRNGFPLVSSKNKRLLIAGGIGITPILSMAQTLHNSANDYELHYFVRGQNFVPFKERLHELRKALTLHEGLDIDCTRSKIRQVLNSCNPTDIDLYVCGPAPMIEMVVNLATAKGVPTESIYFEYFKNEDFLSDGSSFTVQLAKAGVEFKVSKEQTVIEACAENGIIIESSCEQGVCGTCLTKVISGDLDHRDLYLSKKEKESGEWIMPCVSRAKAGKLVLDL